MVVFTAIGMISCNQNGRQATSRSEPDTEQINPPDTVVQKISDGETLQVVAGASVGTLVLKTLVSDSLFLTLGKPDSGDAAMCKSWSMWYWGERELDLFAVCDPDVDMQKTLKMIRLKGFDYTLERQGGYITPKSSLEDIQLSFPKGNMIAIDPESTLVSDSLYQVPVDGIAFEIDPQGKNTAVLIFPKGTELEHQYIPRQHQ